MLVSGFKVNSRLKNTQKHFSGINIIFLMRTHRKKNNGHFLYIDPGVVTIKLLIASNCLVLSYYKVYRFSSNLIQASN